MLLAFSVQSCGFIEDLFGKKEVKVREEKRDGEEKAEVKEIKWKDITKDAEVIKKYPDREDLMGDKDFFDVLCLLPLQGDHRNKGRAFYAGLKMAAENLTSPIKMRFTTLDAGRLSKEPEVMRKILDNPEFDLIVAPYATRDVNQVVDLSKGSGIPVFSPWNTSASVHSFPGYIQMSPGLDSHLRSMVQFTEREYGNDRTMIMAERKDASLVESIQKMSRGIKTYYTSNNPRENAKDIEELIGSGSIQAIIIPSWRSSDEAYFISLLSVLNAARNSRDINVFILSSWLNNDNVHYDQLRGLNLHFTNSRYVDFERNSIKRFEERFYNKYQYFADDDVFYGHDMFLLTRNLLGEYGYQIQKEIENFNCTDCFFKYNFIRSIGENKEEFILNDHVDIIAIKDFKFLRVN